MGTIKILDGSFKAQIRHYNKDINMYHIYRANENHKEIVYDVHMDFLKAGANIIRTNTTGAFLHFMQRKYVYTEETYKQLIKTAVSIAQSAVNEYNKTSTVPWEPACVVGSCGNFKPTKPMSRDEIKNEYRRLIQALSAAGIDMFCMEGIQSREEADMLIGLLQELPEDRTSAFMMFKPKNGFLEDGSFVVDTAIHCYRTEQVFAVGVNCVSPTNAQMLLSGIQRKQNLQNKIPLIVCTNKGNNMKKDWKPIQTVNNTLAKEWVEAGVRYIGGCCAVYPQHIKLIREVVQQHNGSPA